MTEEMVLLREYAASRSQPAFARLVDRYVDLVYTAARRQVAGDAHLAEDVTQAVFLVLAEKAKSVPVDRPLSAWLLKVTRYCAANARRHRQRQESHERRAAQMARFDERNTASATEAEWETLAPMLDQGLSKLGEADRNALLLRFFEKKSLRQVGDALGISEEAAQKRVTRAVGKLRDFFRKRGATVGAGALATLLTTESIKAAPAGLSGTVGAASGVTAATAATPAAAAVAKGAMLAMAMHKTAAVTAAGLVLLLGIGAGTMAVRSAFGTGGRTRHVSVPVPPPAPNRSTVVFSDGSSASVLGIAETSSPPASASWLSSLLQTGAGNGASRRPTQWWTTDGSTQPAPNLPTFGQISAGDLAGRRQVLFTFSLRGAAANDSGLAVRIANTNGSASTSRMIGQEQVAMYVCSLPATLERTNVSLGVSRGPWREDASISPATTTRPTTRTTGPRFFTTITQTGPNTVAVDTDENGRPSVGDRAVRVVAVLKNGQTAGSREWRSMGNRGQIKFDCRLDQIERIAYSTRPYEWQTIGNVALKPAGATSQPAAAAAAATTTRVAAK